METSDTLHLIVGFLGGIVFALFLISVTQLILKEEAFPLKQVLSIFM